MLKYVSETMPEILESAGVAGMAEAAEAAEVAEVAVELKLWEPS